MPLPRLPHMTLRLIVLPFLAIMAGFLASGFAAAGQVDIEDFDCYDGNCDLPLQMNRIANYYQAGSGCDSTIVDSTSGSENVYAKWYDYKDRTGGTLGGDGRGAQELGFEGLGSVGEFCSGVSEYTRLRKDVTSLNLYAQSVSAWFMVEYSNWADPKIHMYVTYMDGSTSPRVTYTYTDTNMWIQMTAPLDPNKRVRYIYLEAGGRMNTSGVMYFDDITAEEYDPPICRLEPSSLDFGENIALEETRERTFTIYNDGGSDLNGNISESCSEYRIVTGGGNFSINPGETHMVRVALTPETHGTKTCSIQLGAEGCESILATGRTGGQCYVNPDSLPLDFGTNIALGEKRQRSFQIDNVGGGNLSGNVIGCIGFTVIEGGGQFNLLAGHSRTVIVEFEAPSHGTHSCPIQINATGCGPVTAIAQTAAECAIVPSSRLLDFGDVAIGASASQEVTIYNNGGDHLVGTWDDGCGPFSVSAVDPGRAVAGPAYSIAPGENEKFRVTYAPTGEEGDTCNIFSGTYCDSIEVRGRGYLEPACSLSTNPLVFGEVPIGTTEDLSFTVTNSGGGTLSGQLDTGCDEFSILEVDRSYELTGGQTATFTARFTPAVAGSSSCMLGTGSDDCGALSLYGVGVIQPICDVFPGLLTFDPTEVGEEDTLTFTVANDGSGLLEGEVGSGCGPFAVITADRTYSLGGDDSNQFTVVFTPISAGSFECDLSTGTACEALPVSGTGYTEVRCDLSPDSIDFAAIPAGEIADQTFTIANNGSAQLTGTVASACGPFTVTDADLNYDLAPGNSALFNVQFAPQSAGSYSCTLDVGIPCGGLPLSGSADEALPACAVSTALLDFGNVVHGESHRLGFSIENSGGGLLTGSIDAGCGPFTVQGSVSYSIGGNTSQDFLVDFVPSAVGAVTCSLSLGNGCPPLALTGNGLAPCVLSVIAPAAATALVVGEETTLEWDPSGCVGAVDIELLTGGESPVVCGTIASNIPNSGSHTWTVFACSPDGAEHRIRISAASSHGPDNVADSEEFSIADPPNASVPVSTFPINHDPVNEVAGASNEIRLVNSGSGPLAWNAEADVPWIDLPVTEGEVAPGETLSVVFAIDTEQLISGENPGGFMVYTNDPSSPEIAIDVSVEVRQYLKGDVSVDDLVDLADLALLIQHVLAEELLRETIVRVGISDLNDDGATNVSDIYLLATRVLEQSFGVAPKAAGGAGADRSHSASIDPRAGGGAILLSDLGGIRAGMVELDWEGDRAPRSLGISDGCSDFVAVGESDGSKTRIVFFRLDAAEGSNPALPAKSAGGGEVACLSWTEPGQSFAVSGGEVAVGRGDDLVLRMVAGTESMVSSLPTGIRLMAPRPNPIAGSALFFYELARPAAVRLAVYDIAGRSVRVVVDESRPAGSHSIAWDGRASSGEPAPAGLYFLRLEAENSVKIRKITILR